MVPPRSQPLLSPQPCHTTVYTSLGLSYVRVGLWGPLFLELQGGSKNKHLCSGQEICLVVPNDTPFQHSQPQGRRQFGILILRSDLQPVPLFPLSPGSSSHSGITAPPLCEAKKITPSSRFFSLQYALITLLLNWITRVSHLLFLTDFEDQFLEL